MRPKQPELPKIPKGVLHTLVVLGIVALAATAYATLSHPLTSWRKDATRKARLVRSKLADGPEYRREHAEQKEKLERLLAYVDDVNRRVPDEPRESEFLATLNSFAKSSGVVIDDFQRGQSLDAGTHSVVTVTIKARGGHAGIAQLVEAIADLPRLVELIDLDITGSTETNHYPVKMVYALYYGMVTTESNASTATE